MGWTEGPVRVRVPAASANLGPGFDSLGLPSACTMTWTRRSARPGFASIPGEGADLADLLAARELPARGPDKLPGGAVFQLATGRARH
jgi:hypothetical protein